MNEELKIIIRAEIAEAQKNIKAVKDEVEDLGEEGDKSSGKFKNAMGKVGDAAKTVAKVSAAAFAAAGAAVVGLTKAAIDNYAEYEQLVGGVETLFKDSASIVKGYADEAYKSAGMSANEYMTTVTSFSASLLQSVGGDTKKAAEAGNQAVIDMADNANKMGTSMEMIQNAYQGFAKQNFTMLDNLKLGYGGTKEEMQRLLEDASKISGVKYDISNLNDVYSAIHVIQTELGITGTTAKEASSTIQGSAAAMKSSWQNLLTGMADENADFDGLITKFIESVGTFADNLIPRIGVVAEGIVKLIGGLVPKIVEEIPKLASEVLPMVITAVTSIITAIAEALPSLMTMVVAIIPDLITGFITAFGAIVDALPTLITTIVDGLVTLLPQLIEGVIQMIVMLCESIGDIITPIVEALPDIIIVIIEALMNNLPSLISGLITLILAIVDAIPQIIQGLVDALPIAISAIIDGLLSCIPQLIVGFIQLIIGVAKAVPQIFSSLKEAMVNVFKGIWDGVTKVFSKVGTWFKDKFGEAVKAIKSIFSGIGSFFTGIWDNIKNIFAKVGSVIGNAVSGAISKAVNWVLEKAIGIINGFIKAINFAIDVINLIPGVDIGKIKLLDVPKMAKGGIVDSATLAVVGEQGKEAVVPLENNTEWLDKIAARLGANSSKPIYLMIDKKVLGVASAEGINDITRQTGNIPLVIA